MNNIQNILFYAKRHNTALVIQMTLKHIWHSHFV